MIRETLPDCGGQSSERAVSMYRMWHCFDCGLQFSMKTLEWPSLCPRCGIKPMESRDPRAAEALANPASPPTPPPDRNSKPKIRWPWKRTNAIAGQPPQRGLR